MQLWLNGSSKQLYSSQLSCLQLMLAHTRSACLSYVCRKSLQSAVHTSFEQPGIGRILCHGAERVWSSVDALPQCPLKAWFFQCLAMSISTTSIHFNPLQFLHKFAHVAGIKKLIHPVLWSLKHFETCWNSLRPDRVCYGPKQVFEAIEKCAVQTLMVSGPIFLSLGTPKWDGPS